MKWPNWMCAESEPVFISIPPFTKFHVDRDQARRRAAMAVKLEAAIAWLGNRYCLLPRKP